MKIKGLDHVAIGVKDLDAAVAWFSRVLGTEFLEIEGTADANIQQLGARYLLSLDHGVELISPILPLPPTAPAHIQELARLLEQRDHVLMRIAFRVEDARESAFRDRGIRLAGKIEAAEVKPLPLRNVKEFLAREEDTLGIQMMFVEFEEA